ncbi:sodium-coupled monocarboxylate transporter 1-like [Haemaphysalis longicornis]
MACFPKVKQPRIHTRGLYVRLRYNTVISIMAAITYIILSQMVGAIAIYSSSVAMATSEYYFQGGFRGVVWADCVQGLLALAVPILVVCKVAYDSNSGQFKTWPLSELEPRKTILLGTVMLCIFYSLGAAEAMALSCRYRGCDPQMLGQITRTDQILPFYVLNDLKALPGLSGIFLAGVVSASISTVSSLVNSQAAVVYMDVVTPFFKVDSSSVSPIIKGIAFAAGCVMTALSLAVAHVGNTTPTVLEMPGSAGPANCNKEPGEEKTIVGLSSREEQIALTAFIKENLERHCKGRQHAPDKDPT